MSTSSQPVFPPDSSADRALEQIEPDTLGADLPLTERLSTDCTLSLNEAFRGELQEFTDKLSVKTSSEVSSKFSSKLSIVFPPESSTKVSSDLDVDWKRKQGNVFFFISGDKKQTIF